jgi:hypothetical protein
VELAADGDDQIPPGGPIYVKVMSTERLLAVADALAKSVVLAYDERAVAAVFDIIEPFARELADALEADGAPFSSGSARLSLFSTVCPGKLPWRRSPTCYGIGRTWSGSTPGSRTNMNSRSASTR